MNQVERVPVCSLGVALGTRTSSDCETSRRRAEGQGASLRESVARKVRTHEGRWWVGEGELPQTQRWQPKQLLGLERCRHSGDRGRVPWTRASQMIKGRSHLGSY